MVKVRGATWSGQFGWMIVGVLVSCVVAVVLWLAGWLIASGSDIPLGLFWAGLTLVVLLPSMGVVTILTASGYRLGGLLAQRVSERESWDLILSAVGALLFGTALAVVASIITSGAFDGYLVWGAVGVAGSVVAVTLARLPLDEKSRRESSGAVPTPPRRRTR